MRSGLLTPSALLSKLLVRPSTLCIVVGTSAPLQVRGVFDDGTERLLDQGISWSGSLSAIASVDDTGRVTAQTPGLAAVTATCLGRSTAVWVHVTTHSVGE